MRPQRRWVTPRRLAYWAVPNPTPRPKEDDGSSGEVREMDRGSLATWAIAAVLLLILLFGTNVVH
jgi:hypothetical protein